MDERIADEIVQETIDNGTIENVHLAPVGEFYGSDSEGNPVAENLTLDSLQQLADELNEEGQEVLCDVDHGASKPGIAKSTRSAGWFTKFIVDPLKGLFASLKLTKHGKELLENREYRFISPTFTLDDEGKPVKLHTASLTNMPAFAGYINPILNQEAEPISRDEGKLTMDLTKEELVDLIKDTVKNMEAAEEKAEEVEETAEETKEEVKEEKKEETAETVENGCSGEEESKAENACSEKPEVKNEETAEAAEEKPAEEKKEEVIKIEALNSKPIALGSVGDRDWMNLHGKEFFDYLAKHPEIRG